MDTHALQPILSVPYPQESLLGAGVVVQLGPQNLNGQIALQGVVAAAVHLAHAADINPL
jgi:hypothetical protein